MFVVMVGASWEIIRFSISGVFAKDICMVMHLFTYRMRLNKKYLKRPELPFIDRNAILSVS